MMSCLPQIFVKSNYIQNPSKMGGVFSLNLRSTSFSARQSASVGEIRSKLPVDGQRYSFTLRREDNHRTSKTGSRSFSQPCKEEGLEQRGHGFGNLNNRKSQQSEVEAASNFNVVKRQTLQALHLARRTLEGVQSEASNIKQQMAVLTQTLTNELENFKEEFCQQCIDLTKEFRTERRGLLGQNKAISQQLTYLGDELGTSGQVGGELQGRLGSIIAQFI